MGDRYCAVDGCNALEFRTTGICNRHLSMGVDPLDESPSIMIMKESEAFEKKTSDYQAHPLSSRTMDVDTVVSIISIFAGALLLLVGGTVLLFGFLLLIQSNEYELNAMAGSILLFLGGLVAALGKLLFTYGRNLTKSE